jgi:hypothetical protein
MLVFTPRWDTQGNFVGAAHGRTVTVYEAAAGRLPNAKQGTHSRRHIVPGPRDAWNASSKFALRGFRPIVLTLPGEEPPAQGDYVFIRFRSDGQAVLLRTQKILEIDSPNDWDTLATSPLDGARVFRQGPALPAPNAGIVQASGGHSGTVFYVSDGRKQLWMWTEGMMDWAQLVPGGGAKSARRFFANPYDPNVIYLLDFDDQHVKRSDDRGGTWQVDTSLETELTCNSLISSDLLDLVLTDMQFDPLNLPSRCAVGEAGAFVTNDGVSWERLLDTGALPGQPANCYLDSISNPSERSLFVALDGRSLLKVSPLP